MKTRLHKRVGRMIRGHFQRKILSRHGLGVLAETENGLYVVEPGNFGVSRKLLRDGAFEQGDLRWLTDALGGEAGMIVVVGTHVGTLLVPLARRARRAVGFEADPHNCRLAGLNLLLNRVENVTLVNKAVGAHEGVVGVRRNAINTGNTSIAPVGEPRSGEVEMTTLDRALGRPSDGSSEDEIDLLVMDIEGYETEALRGGEATLRRTRMLYLEYAPEQLAEHGSNGREVIDLAFANFELLYVFEDSVRSFDREAAEVYLARESRRRGFLRNLLFTRERLPDRAANRGR